MRSIALSLTTLLLLVPATSAGAAIKLTKIQYDSSGSDTGTSGSLNAEWVEIKNTGKKAVNLNGWTLRDTANHVYGFGSFKIKVGKTCGVHSFDSGPDLGFSLLRNSVQGDLP